MTMNAAYARGFNSICKLIVIFKKMAIKQGKLMNFIFLRCTCDYNELLSNWTTTQVTRLNITIEYINYP